MALLCASSPPSSEENVEHVLARFPAGYSKKGVPLYYPFHCWICKKVDVRTAHFVTFRQFCQKVIPCSPGELLLDSVDETDFLQNGEKEQKVSRMLHFFEYPAGKRTEVSLLFFTFRQK